MNSEESIVTTAARPGGALSRTVYDFFNNSRDELGTSVVSNYFTRNLQAFSEGTLVCEECEKDSHLESYPPLQMAHCRHCDCAHFIPKQLGQFWLFQRLWDDTTGTLYNSYHVDFPYQIFAVKILAPHEKADPVRIKSLEDEGKVVCRLGDHPCLLPGVEFGEANGERYLAMESILGERLAQRVKRSGPLAEKDVLLMTLRLISALCHINYCGYLYRHFNPDNVILSYPNGAYLFGYDNCASLQVRKHAQPLATDTFIEYLPPESIRGEEEGIFSQIYGLGMIVYFAISGHSYCFESEARSLAQAKKENKLKLDMKKIKMKGISRGLEKIISRMIDVVPEKRYQLLSEIEFDIVTLFHRLL